MTTKPWCPAVSRKLSPCSGLTAAITAGFSKMPFAPRIASEANHTIITGPKSRPTFPVPSHWMLNKPTSTATVMGRMNGSNTSVATLNPSTALRTEMAGVIIPSP